ncbi:COQ7 protein [Multifurca ochricompacta]|uniref:5-demethoxyubiquinone hydroxylase, mitochondrial n=1 Tax=Multifurca ochricompacta TaxID=376703 RepID=A0AAD4M6E1_9AGAM|nr:COQ7 protein [Multifurca ochricompacta]
MTRGLKPPRLSLSPRLLHSLVQRPGPSSAYLDPNMSPDVSTCSTPNDLSPSRRKVLEAALRVDQAGEVAANYIYQGQLAVLRRDPETAALIQDMWAQERKHLAVMNKLQVQHQIRPTALWEVAKVAGFGLGAMTALMGKEAAMACTEAVETAIGEHYDDQLKDLQGSTHPSIVLLRNVIREFRDDELEHLDTAVENNSQRAPAHALLSSVVGIGCNIAIELCKRI